MRRVAAKLSNDRAGALLAEIARDRGGEFLDRHRRAPEPEARRDRRQVRGHEDVGLQPLDRRGRAPAARSRHSRARLSGKATSTPCTSGADRARAGLRPQAAMPQGPSVTMPCADQAGIGEARQQQRIGPDEDAGGHAGDRAARAFPAARTARRKRRAQVCAMPAKDSSPIDGELRLAGHAVIHVGERDRMHEDRRCAAP